MSDNFKACFRDSFSNQVKQGGQSSQIQQVTTLQGRKDTGLDLVPCLHPYT